MQKKVSYLTNWLPHYRRALYDILLNDDRYDFTIYCQDTLYSKGYESIIDRHPNNIKVINYKDYFNDKVSWQFLPWRKIYKESDILIVDSNPRILTHFLIATIYSLLGKKVILYSMLHSHNNHRFNKFLRITWMRMFKYHLMYNDSEIEELKKMGFQNKVMVAYNNGLDQENIDKVKDSWKKEKLDAWKANHGLKNGIDILAIGRTTKGKYEILIKAMAIIKSKFDNVKLCIIGGGDGLEILKKLIEENGLQNNVKLVGSLHEENELAPYFLSSSIFVHSYAVGLSINHAFGYGLPIITHDNPLYHGPEICLFKEGVTGLAYKNEDYHSLAAKMIQLLNNKKLAESMGREGLRLTQEKYNCKNMASNLLNFMNKII